MDLLLAHGDDGSPILDHTTDPSTAAAAANPAARRTERFLADITANADDLARQGWAVVTTADAEGARLEALVRELVAARAEEQCAEVLAIRVPPGMDSAAANDWKATVYPTLYGEDETRRPRYLVILGDLDRVSLDTQNVLAQDGITGRLACSSDDGYGAYVHKVLAWQRSPSREDRARALFYTVHDGTSATTAGHSKLIVPCHDRCVRAARDKPRTFPASAVESHGAASPDPDELLRLAAARHPSVLLSMSHGMGPPRRRRWSPTEARERQGAMGFGTEGALEVRDMATAPFLPGGLWIYFACFGAGTPRTSAYHHWLQLLSDQGMPELGPVNETLRGLDEAGGFVSGLGKAALANPDGPLAVLSHIDLAWSYSYEELRVGGGHDSRRVSGSNRSLNFFQLISKLVAGARAGAASLSLKLRLGAVGAELNAHYDRCKRAGEVEGASSEELLALGNLWMLHQDLLGFTLLGDPAVRLPLATPDPAAAPAPAPSGPAPSSAVIVPAPGAETARRTAVAVDPDVLDRLEQAALAVFGGESEGVVAARIGMPRSEIVDAARAYRDAGRAALAELVAQRDSQSPDSPEKGRGE
ncbi:MAG TPA: hypothetical protein VHW23_26710 [Kofleriaceae bacterium]|nr:hypothetical protein [Kofleriaceae bacterium]